VDEPRIPILPTEPVSAAAVLQLTEELNNHIHYTAAITTKNLSKPISAETLAAPQLLRLRTKNGCPSETHFLSLNMVLKGFTIPSMKGSSLPRYLIQSVHAGPAGGLPTRSVPVLSPLDVAAAVAAHRRFRKRHARPARPAGTADLKNYEELRGAAALSAAAAAIGIAHRATLSFEMACRRVFLSSLFSSSLPPSLHVAGLTADYPTAWKNAAKSSWRSAGEAKARVSLIFSAAFNGRTSAKRQCRTGTALPWHLLDIVLLGPHTQVLKRRTDKLQVLMRRTDELNISLKRRTDELTNRVNTHSLRAGGANALALSGYSDREIMKMGRWRGTTFIDCRGARGGHGPSQQTVVKMDSENSNLQESPALVGLSPCGQIRINKPGGAGKITKVYPRKKRMLTGTKAGESTTSTLSTRWADKTGGLTWSSSPGTTQTSATMSGAGLVPQAGGQTEQGHRAMRLLQGASSGEF
ncbi:hypothetical protein THAOC_11668, partial [Thalassiosira oceanica]